MNRKTFAVGAGYLRCPPCCACLDATVLPCAGTGALPQQAGLLSALA